MISVKILNKPKSNKTSSRSTTSVASVSKATVADHASFSDQAEYANRAGYASRAAYADQAGSLASYESMDSRYLSKTDDDTASGLITFLKGLLTGNFQTGVNNSGASIDAFGAAEFQSVKVRDFIQAFSATIANITADNLTVNTLLTALEAAITTLTVRDLTVTGVAHFFKLIIDELKSVGGMVMITAANATIYRVETLSNGNYKCYFRSTDGDRRIYNQFEVGDGAICQTFDVAEGTSYNVSNKYYWRRVTDVGSETIDGVETHYITLSYNDCASGSGTPAAGDEVAQLGYYATGTLSDDQKARQSAIVISSYNSNDPGVKAPYFAQYSGINDFDLASHRLNWIARNGIQMTGVFKSIVDGQERNIIDILDDLANQFEAIKGQVDNKFDIWYGHGVPTLNNEPASLWSSSEYESHLQDIYYDLDKEAASDGGNCYRFSWTGSKGYFWDKVTDAKTLAVLEKISDVASDGILSGGMEKVRIYIEWMAAVADYSYYLQQVTTMGLTSDNDWMIYVDALEALGTFLNGGTSWTVSSLSTVPTWINDANRSVTTGTPDNPISASEYRTVWTDYYEAYAALLQKLGVTTYNISNERTKVFVTNQSISSNPVPPAAAIQGETPAPPYKAGDFWLYTLLTGEQKMFICTTNQVSAYSPSHWQDMSDVIVSSDIRYNMRVMMDKLADDDTFVAWYSKAEVVNNGYIQVIICDSVSEAGHYYYNNGIIYDGETDNEVTPVLASLAVDGSTVYQYRDVTVDGVTTRQWVNMNISDLPICLLTIYVGTLETTWNIYRALANNAAEHSGAMVPNTFTAQFAAATEALPNQKKTITADGYLYYYQNGDAWEPLGDNQDHSVIQNLGDAIVMAVWGNDSSSQIAINRNSIQTLSQHMITVNGNIENLQAGMANKVSGNGAFSELFSQAVNSEGIVKRAELSAYVTKETDPDTGEEYLQSGVKISADDIVLSGSDGISMMVGDVKDGLKRTGINIQEGEITLNGDTQVNGELSLNSKEGFSLNNDDGSLGAKLHGGEIPSLADWTSSTSSGKNVFHNNMKTFSTLGSQSFVLEYNHIDLGYHQSSDVITINQIYITSNFPLSNSGLTFSIYDDNGNIVASKVVSSLSNISASPYRYVAIINLTYTSNLTARHFYFGYSMNLSGSPSTANNNFVIQLNYTVSATELMEIGSNGLATRKDSDDYMYMGKSEFEVRHGNNGLQVYTTDPTVPKANVFGTGVRQYYNNSGQTGWFPIQTPNINIVSTNSFLWQDNVYDMVITTYSTSGANCIIHLPTTRWKGRVCYVRKAGVSNVIVYTGGGDYMYLSQASGRTNVSNLTIIDGDMYMFVYTEGASDSAGKWVVNRLPSP